MHPYLNVTLALLIQEERLREAERHRRYRGGRRQPTEPRWWRWRGNRGLRKSDHSLAA